MSRALQLRTFQIGARRIRAEGLRIGTTRRPSRGVPRTRWRSDGYFDVWLPTVAPSAGLIRRFRERDVEDAAVRQKFFDAYERELTRTEARQTIELLAAVARKMPIAIGCFCADERRCHRSRLRTVIRRAASATSRRNA
jgi:uncharacterized protein YeaO (DUF488 family)